MSKLFAGRVIAFHRQLRYDGDVLPAGIRIMNPFIESPVAMKILKEFAEKFLAADQPRRLILGINPGRFGGGLTGIPFTDPKRLVSECGIPYDGKVTHEPSSVFIYEMIHAYGGVSEFYRDCYINSPCPLGFTSVKPGGKEVNYNYYDSPELAAAVKPFMVKSMRQLMELGVHRDKVFCLGTGKNEKFLRKLNEEFDFFDELVALEHPRFVMQYKARTKDVYLEKYVSELKG